MLRGNGGGWAGGRKIWNLWHKREKRSDNFGIRTIWLGLLPLQGIRLFAPTFSECGECHLEYEVNTPVYGREKMCEHPHRVRGGGFGVNVAAVLAMVPVSATRVSVAVPLRVAGVVRVLYVLGDLLDLVVRCGQQRRERVAFGEETTTERCRCGRR